MPEPRKRGGARKGTGPKPSDGVTGVSRYSVTLDPASDELARQLGGGDRSLGLRRALALVRAGAAKQCGEI